MRVAVEPTLRVLISSDRIVQANADVAEAGEGLHRLGDQDVRVHTRISVVMEAAMRAVRQQHSGPARQAVALGNMFAGGLPFNGNNRTFIARL